MCGRFIKDWLHQSCSRIWAARAEPGEGLVGILCDSKKCKPCSEPLLSFSLPHRFHGRGSDSLCSSPSSPRAYLAFHRSATYSVPRGDTIQALSSSSHDCSSLFSSRGKSGVVRASSRTLTSLLIPISSSSGPGRILSRLSPPPSSCSE